MLSLSLVLQSMFHGFSTLDQRHDRFTTTQHPSSSCAESSTSPRCGSDWRGSLLSHIPSHSSFCRDCSCRSQSDWWFSSSSGCTSTCAWKVTTSSSRSPFRHVVMLVNCVLTAMLSLLLLLFSSPIHVSWTNIKGIKQEWHNTQGDLETSSNGSMNLANKEGGKAHATNQGTHSGESSSYFNVSDLRC